MADSTANPAPLGCRFWNDDSASNLHNTGFWNEQHDLGNGYLLYG